jgi:hypothetical protein
MAVVVAVLLLGGYYLMAERQGTVPSSADGAPEAANQAANLGPADGRDLPGQDTGRVMVGDAAPDFSLLAYSGDVVTLSDFRGQKNVVLAFYRGHW